MKESLGAIIPTELNVDLSGRSKPVLTETVDSLVRTVRSGTGREVRALLDASQPILYSLVGIMTPTRSDVLRFGRSNEWRIELIDLLVRTL